MTTMTMTMFASEAGAGGDEQYWADGTAAAPVLLLDEATEAITEAVHRIRRGSVLEHRDVSAAGVALGDLFGGLAQLAALCTTVVSPDAGTDPRQIGWWQDRWQTLGMTMLSAQQVAEDLKWGSAAVPLGGDEEKVPVPRDDHNGRVRGSHGAPLRTFGGGSSDRPVLNGEIRLVKTRSGGS